MNRFKISALLVAFLVSLPMLAQNKLYFVQDATEAGEPVGQADAWAIAPEGGSLYMLYTNNKKPIKDAALGIKLEKKNDAGAYALADELSVEPDKGKTWVLVELPFTEAGEYRVTMLDAAGKNLAVANVEVVYDEATADVAEAPVVEDISEAHAKGYKISFSETLDAEGMPVAPKKEFKLVSGSAKVNIQLMHSQTLKANQFTVSIVKNGDKKTEELYTLDGDATWNAITFEQEFTQPGTYTILFSSPSGLKLAFDIIKIK